MSTQNNGTVAYLQLTIPNAALERKLLRQLDIRHKRW